MGALIRIHPEVTRDPNEPAPLRRVIGTVLFYFRTGRIGPGNDLLECGHEVPQDCDWLSMRTRVHARRRCWVCREHIHTEEAK